MSDEPVIRSPDRPMIRWPDGPIIYDAIVKKIRVRFPKNSYDVMIANGLLSRGGREIKRLLPGPSSRVFVITSPSVRRFWGETLERSLNQAKLNCQFLEMN